MNVEACDVIVRGIVEPLPLADAALNIVKFLSLKEFYNGKGYRDIFLVN